MNNRLYKKEKLCSAVAIDRLFSRDAANMSVSAYPIRIFWRENPGRKSDAPVQFLISVPKKKLRHAVDRVKMRRRIREAYRLTRNDFPITDGKKYDVIFLYVDTTLQPYSRIVKSMQRLLAALQKPAEQ